MAFMSMHIEVCVHVCSVRGAIFIVRAHVFTFHSLAAIVLLVYVVLQLC